MLSKSVRLPGGLSSSSSPVFSSFLLATVSAFSSGLSLPRVGRCVCIVCLLVSLPFLFSLLLCLGLCVGGRHNKYAECIIDANTFGLGNARLLVFGVFLVA